MPFMIKQMRISKGMTQEQLCKAAGISRQIVVDLESGRDVNTTTDTLKKLADALGCRVSDIFCP